MDRLLNWAFLLLVGWYLYDSGIAMAFVNGFVPEVGRKCVLQGPKEGHIFLALSKDDVTLPIDATIGYGTSGRHTSEVTLAQRIANGDVLVPGNNTKVKVLANAKAHLLVNDYKVTKVEVLNGGLKGTKGWVRREDVIDTPIQQVLQDNFRDSAKVFEKELESVDPNEKDQTTISPPRRMPRGME